MAASIVGSCPVQDQIILQACVIPLAEKVDQSLDRKRVFSYPRNATPESFELVGNKLESWSRFQTEVTNLAKQHGALLKIDLQSAYATIKQLDFIAYLNRIAPQANREIGIIKSFLAAYQSNGIPFVNDSLFFLGNGFLGKVDDVIRTVTPNFVRFVDDYRIFGSSTQELEAIFSSISRKLEPLGFLINDNKLSLTRTDDFLDEMVHVHYEDKSQKDRESATPVVIDGVMEPADLLDKVREILQAPDDKLNEGLGRSILGALRRVRRNDQKAKEVHSHSPASTPLDDFRDLFLADRALHATTLNLFEVYAPDQNETWRALWILHLLLCITPRSGAYPAADRQSQIIKQIQASAACPAVLKLWVHYLTDKSEKVSDDDIFSLDYLALGKSCFKGIQI